MDKPRLLWHSNSPWTPTGYGQQTALFCPRLKERYELAISSYYGLEGNWIPWDGIPVAPGLGGEELGNATIRDHAKAFFDSPREGLVLTLMDVWPLSPDVWRHLNVASWCPVDHDPAPHRVLSWFEKTGAVPIAMSRFGQERLPDALYCPHAVDWETFQPIEKAREKTKLPKDAFVVGIVAANKGNPSRKCFPQALQAMAAFCQRHDDAMLYLHTEMLGKIRGVNLALLIKELGLAEKVKFCDQYRCMNLPISPEDMATTYSSFDVLLNCSAGEGFGIPVLEAQSCGVPAIVTDFSAMPEVCGAGWHVDYERQWVGRDDLAGPSWMAWPDVEDIVESLEAAYGQSEDERKRLSRQARAHAKGYDVETVVTDYMVPALDAAYERFEAREPVKVAA